MIYLFIPEQFIMPDFGTIYTKIYKNSMTGLIYKNEHWNWNDLPCFLNQFCWDLVMLSYSDQPVTGNKIQ